MEFPFYLKDIYTHTQANKARPLLDIWRGKSMKMMRSLAGLLTFSFTNEMFCFLLQCYAPFFLSKFQFIQNSNSAHLCLNFSEEARDGWCLLCHISDIFMSRSKTHQIGCNNQVSNILTEKKKNIYMAAVQCLRLAGDLI